MDQTYAAGLVEKATTGRQALSTHQLATILLVLPDQPLLPIDQQGGPEAWTTALHPAINVQVGIRSW